MLHIFIYILYHTYIYICSSHSMTKIACTFNKVYSIKSDNVPKLSHFGLILVTFLIKLTMANKENCSRDDVEIYCWDNLYLQIYSVTPKPE